MVVELVAGLCRLSLAFHAAGNGSPNLRRSHSGHWAGVCWSRLVVSHIPSISSDTARKVDWSTYIVGIGRADVWSKGEHNPIHLSSF